MAVSTALQNLTSTSYSDALFDDSDSKPGLANKALFGAWVPLVVVLDDAVHFGHIGQGELDDAA